MRTFSWLTFFATEPKSVTEIYKRVVFPINLAIVYERVYNLTFHLSRFSGAAPHINTQTGDSLWLETIEIGY